MLLSAQAQQKALLSQHKAKIGAGLVLITGPSLYAFVQLLRQHMPHIQAVVPDVS